MHDSIEVSEKQIAINIAKRILCAFPNAKIHMLAYLLDEGGEDSVIELNGGEYYFTQPHLSGDFSNRWGDIWRHDVSDLNVNVPTKAGSYA